jgi:tyrosinase
LSSNNSVNKTSSSSNPKVFISKPLKFEIKKLENSFYRADLEFHGIEHSGPSYEGRVFINNPEANEDTFLSIDKGYVGSYFVFGHGGCYGDTGHCEVTERSRFDFRPPHSLTPIYLRLVITNQIKELGKNTDEFIVSIVPVLAGGSDNFDNEDVVRLDSISIVSYNN